MKSIDILMRVVFVFSIEKGYPHWHQEIRIDDNPLEAGLLFTCKLRTDTDFLGRDKLEVSQGVNNFFFVFDKQ